MLKLFLFTEINIKSELKYEMVSPITSYYGALMIHWITTSESTNIPIAFNRQYVSGVIPLIKL